MADAPTTTPAPGLLAALRRIAVRRLSYDPRTGRRYAVGFDADGNPYRAFGIDTEDASDDTYQLAQ